MAVVLDSDAVVGFLDGADALHAAADMAIRDLILKQRLLVSVVTYAEVLTGAKLGHHDEERVAGFFADLISDILPADVAIAHMAAEFRSQQKALQMPDALILATAEAASDVELVVTGDAVATRVQGFNCEVRLLR